MFEFGAFNEYSDSVTFADPVIAAVAKAINLGPWTGAFYEAMGAPAVTLATKKFEIYTRTKTSRDGVIGASVTQSLYKGTYYQVQVYTDTDEDFYIDTADEWDMDDRVGVTIDGSKVRLEKYDPEEENAEEAK